MGLGFGDRTGQVETLEEFRFSIYWPDVGKFRLSLPMQMIEDGEHWTLTAEQG